MSECERKGEGAGDRAMKGKGGGRERLRENWGGRKGKRKREKENVRRRGRVGVSETD